MPVRKKKLAADLQDMVSRWNMLYGVGKLVKFYPEPTKDAHTIHHTASPAQLQGFRAAVIRLEGIEHPVPLDQVVPC